MADKSLSLPALKLGVCYYPEHWDESLWEDDFRRMRDLDFSVVRMGEFAWNFFEPEEGVYAFDLFDRAIALAHANGLQVILGTPTATPPAWLTYKHPEVLNVSQDGVTYQHGMRCHYNYSSPVYKKYCAAITRAMAVHYADNSAVIGWQIDNELNCAVNVFYSAADHAAFREWLKQKYGSLEALNQAWGAVFWNQSYSAWEQVHLTRPTPSQAANPHQALDEKRFISANTIAFAALQAEILRELAPKQLVTTNGLFGHLDSHAMTQELLDFFSYDSYPNFAAISEHKDDDFPLKDRSWSSTLAKVRSISANFCVMEQQSGPGGWVDRMEQPSPKPGQMRLWTYQSIAHGADMVLYFRWRTATFGTEIYWHGINDYHNQPNRRVAEAAQTGKELQQIGGLVAGSRYAADVAIIRNYDNEWDGEMDTWHGPLSRESEYSWFKALQRRHVPVDYLYLSQATELSELSRYRALVYPHGAVMTNETARLLQDYTAAGGVVVFGARTGYKDERGHCRMVPFPGPVAGLCGITVEDFTLIPKNAVAPPIRWTGEGADGLMDTRRFNDILRLEADTAEVLAEYAGDYYEGKPALSCNRHGKGRAYYYGSAFTREVADALITRLGLQAVAADWLEAPAEVEVAVREKEGRRVVFLLNYTAQAGQVKLLREATDLLGAVRLPVGPLRIGPYGVQVLELSQVPDLANT